MTPEQTGNFIIVAALLIVVVAGGYRWRVSRIAVRNQELETQVAERTRILAQRTHELEGRNREIERRRQELEALYRADAELHRYLGLDQVLHALVDIAVDILEADKSALLVWDKARDCLVVRVARGYRPETLPQMVFAPGEGTAGHVLNTGEPVIVADARVDPRVAKRATTVEPEGICAFMQVPIKIGGEIFGVFSADYIRPRAFGEDEQRLFVALAQRAALAIDTAQLYEQSKELAVMEERNRLARDLHDAVTQTLFSASLIAEVLPTLWEVNQAEGRRLLKELRQMSRGAQAEMRTLLLELRPATLVETELGDLLRQLGEALTGREGIPVQVRAGEACELPPDVHFALYRIAQEALNNIAKHAQATHVDVTLQCFPAGGVGLSIIDDGGGFDIDQYPTSGPRSATSSHFGLNIMRERAAAIGADFEVQSCPGQGTQVLVRYGDLEAAFEPSLFPGLVKEQGAGGG